MDSEHKISAPLEDWIISIENNGSAMCSNLTGLWPDSYYQLEVSAQNDLGWSESHKVFIFKTAPSELSNSHLYEFLKCTFLSTSNASNTSEHPEAFQTLHLFHFSKFYHIFLQCSVSDIEAIFSFILINNRYIHLKIEIYRINFIINYNQDYFFAIQNIIINIAQINIV